MFLGSAVLCCGRSESTPVQMGNRSHVSSFLSKSQPCSAGKQLLHFFFFLFSQTERKPSTSYSVKYGGRNLTLDFNSLCVLLLLYIFACLPPFGGGNFISLEEGDFVLLVVSAIVHEMSPIIILLIYFKERLTIVSAVLFACIYRKWNPLGIKCVFQFMFLKRLWIIFLIISFQI